MRHLVDSGYLKPNAVVGGGGHSITVVDKDRGSEG